jgi:hypothetical protein
MASGLKSIALFRSVGGRLAVAVFVILGAGAGLQVWQTRTWDRASIEHGEQARIRGVAAATAAHISGDAHEAAVKATPSMDQFVTWGAAPKGALDLHKQLATVVSQVGLETPIYTLRLRDDAFDRVRARPDEVHEDAMEFIATSADAPNWRHLYEYRPDMAPALWGGTLAVTGIYERERGAWISAYAPVFDGDGRVVALLEVDEPFEEIQTAQATRFRRQVILFASVGGGVFLLMFLIARRLATGFDLIEGVASRLGDGDFATPADAGSYVEVGHMAGALERTRVLLAQREARMQAAAAQIAHQQDLALRGITDASLQRRRELKEARKTIRAAVRVGKGAPIAVRLADISNRSASVLTKSTLDLPPGAPVQLRIGSTASGQNVVVWSTVLGRVALSEDVYEYDLRMDEDATHLTFPQPVHRIMNFRDAMRVSPTAPGQVDGAVVIGDRRFRFEVMDISVTGMGVRVDRGAEVVARWGTTLVVELRFTGRSEPVAYDVDVARIWTQADGSTRMGLVLYDAKKGGFAHRQQSLAEFVDARSRERAMM